MNVVSLFAGVGGFDIAAERAGMEVVGQVEIDKFARTVLESHWPTISRFVDIHDVTGSCFDGTNVDVLVGGFPCQDYSTAGHNKGLAGDRGALWWQFHRLIDEIRPTWVVGENVDGLTNKRHRSSFLTITESLLELGYGVVWRVLDSQYFGVPQRRKRVFIVGHSGGKPRPEILSLAEGSTRHFEESSKAGKKVTGRPRGYIADSGIVRALTTRYGTAGTDLTDAEAGHVIAVAKTAPPLSARASAGGGLGTDTELSGGLIAFAQNQRDEVREVSVAGALAAKPGIKQQTFLNVPWVRRLTPIECERLQGFPDNWTSMVSDTQRYKQMGNAVTVPVAEWIFKNIASK